MVSFNRKGSAEQVETLEHEETGQAPAPRQEYASSGVSHAAFPRVNLIPDEIAHEAKVRRAKIVLVGSVAAAVAAAGGLYVMASNDVSAAQDAQTAATARSAALSTEAAKYADVPKVKADLASAQAQQAAAMGGEVRWSFVLNNLALTVPAGTGLTSLNASITGAAPAAGDAATGSSIKSVLGNPGIGTIAFEGEALDNTKVAAFLEGIARNAGFTDPFVTRAAKEEANAATGAPKSTKFTASVTINGKALSHRFDAKGN